MTQKKIGDDLYIFKQEAYEITADTDASNIFVQLELVDAFKTLNEDLASKIVPINYNLFQVTKPIYADYINAEDPEPEVETPTGEQGATGENGTTGTTNVGQPTGEGGETPVNEPEGTTPEGESSTAEVVSGETPVNEPEGSTPEGGE